MDGLLRRDSTMKEKQQGFCLGGGRGRSEGKGHGVQVGLVFSGLTLGAQKGPQHRDGGEEEVAATQAAAGAVTGEDGLWSLIQGLIGWTHINLESQAGSVHEVGRCGRDVVVFVARPELKAQGKGGEELELL